MSISDKLRDIAIETECASGRCEKLYRGDLETIADDIDEIYEALEAENVKLRKELEKLSAIIDADTLDFIQRLRDATEKREDVTIYGIEYMPYPVDADGVAIHLDDLLVTTTDGTLTWAASIERFSHGWRIHDNTCNYDFPDYYRHYHEPTVTEILWDLINEDWYNADTEEDRTKIIERYAKRLQLKDSDADE